MKISEEAKAELKEDDAFEMLLQNRAQVMEMTAGAGYQVWMRWAKKQMDAYEHECFEAPTVELREEARISRKALKRFSDIPAFLGELLKEEVS